MKKIKIFVLVCSLIGCGCFLKAGAMEKTNYEKSQLTSKSDYKTKDEGKIRKYTKDMFYDFCEPEKNVIEFESIKLYPFLRKYFLEAKNKPNELEYLKEVFSKYIEQFVFKGELELFNKLEEGKSGQIEELKKIFEILKNSLRLVFLKRGNSKEKKLVVLKDFVPEKKSYFEKYFQNIENMDNISSEDADKYDDYDSKCSYCLRKLRDFVVFYNTYSYYF